MASGALGSLFVSLGLDAGEFTGGLSKAEHQLNQFANATAIRIGAISGVVSVGVGKLVEKLGEGLKEIPQRFKEIIDAADELGKTSQKIGIAAEQLAAFQYIAKLSGVSSEEFTLGVGKLSVKMADAAGGAKDATAVFDALGIKVTSNNGELRSSGDVLKDIAEKFSGYKDSAEKTALAVALFGKNGRELIPFLNAGASGIADLEREAEKLGVTLGAKVTKPAEEFNDNMIKIEEAMKKGTRTLVNELLPALVSISEKFLEAAKAGGGFLGAIQVMLGTTKAQFEEPGKGIEEVTAQLEGFVRKRDELMGKTTTSSKVKNFLFGDFVKLNLVDLDSQITVAKNRIEFLKGLQLKPYKDLADAFGTETKTKAPVLAKNKDDQTTLIKKLYEGQIQAVNDFVAAQQHALSIQETFYTRYYAENLVSIKDYYDKRQQISAEGLAAELAGIDKQIALRRAEEAQLPKGADRQEMENKIAELQNKRRKVQIDADVESVKIEMDRHKAFKDYENVLQGVNAQLLEMQGHLAEAAAIRFDLQNDQLRERFKIEGNINALEKQDRLKQVAIDQAKVNELTREAQLFEAQLANAEKRTALEQQTGALSELAAMGKTTEARQKAVIQLQEIADKYKALAATVDPDSAEGKKIKQAADDFQLHVEELAASADVLKNKFKDMFTGEATNFFAAIIDGSKSAKQAFDDFAKSIQQQISRLIAQKLAKELFGEATSGSSGGLLSGAAGFFASLFGGGKAGGGPVSGGSIYQVAEQGPEVLNTGGKSYLMMGNQGGNVVPLRGGGGAPINININVPANVSRSTSEQIATQTAAAVDRARRRSG